MSAFIRLISPIKIRMFEKFDLKISKFEQHFFLVPILSKSDFSSILLSSVPVGKYNASSIEN